MAQTLLIKNENALDIVFVGLSDEEFNTFNKLYSKVRFRNDDNARKFKEYYNFDVTKVEYYGTGRMATQTLRKIIPFIEIVDKTNCLSLADVERAKKARLFIHSYKCFQPYKKYKGEQYKDRQGNVIPLLDMYKIAHTLVETAGTIPHEDPQGSWNEIVAETGNNRNYLIISVKETDILTSIHLNVEYHGTKYI